MHGTTMKTVSDVATVVMEEAEYCALKPLHRGRIVWMEL